MSSTILIRRSSTAGSVPTTAQLTAGELAINLADKKIYTNTGSSIIELGTIASTMAVEGALGVDGNFDVNTNKFTVASATGNTSIAGTLDVTGNSQVDGDFTVLGAISIEEPTANSHAATKFYVDQAVTDLIGTAGSALDTLGELADALNDDANFASTVTSALATKLNLAGGTMTGNIVMGANKVTSTATPTSADDLTRKGYIDALYGSTASAAASATAAETAETNAETARDAAQTAQAAAETAETNAAASASSASTSATNAGNSASAANTSASSASTSASSASTSASNAATSATNAENAYDNFDDRYLGAKATDPTVDNDGDALITGAMYFDSSNNVMKVYSGTEWQNASSSIEGIKSDFVYTATASQVLFSGADDNTDTLVIDKAGLVNVYLNGVRLTDADYTINTTGNSVTLGSGATVGDIVEIEVFGNFAGQSGADVAITGGSITGLTELSTGTFTSTGIDDNATSTAITIDASENVGIGTSSPATPLHISGASPVALIQATSGDSAVQIQASSGSNSSTLRFGDNIDGDVGRIHYTHSNNAMSFYTGATEKARIDSNGNLLVNQTSATSGYKFQVTGLTQISGADTKIRMGQLDSTYTYLQAIRGDVGGDIKIFGGLHPQDGVYLGGTGAANKLDDYEEGIWTPTAIGITSAGVATYNIYRNGYYTKVGNMVHAHGIIGWLAHTGSGALAIIGLPFPSSTSTYNYSAVTMGEYNGLTVGVNNYLTGTLSANSSIIGLQRIDTSSGSSTVAQVSLDNSVSYITFSVTYKTDS